MNYNAAPFQPRMSLVTTYDLAPDRYKALNFPMDIPFQPSTLPLVNTYDLALDFYKSLNFQMDVPFQSSIPLVRTYALTSDADFYKVLDLAMDVPLAPIRSLTVLEKYNMQVGDFKTKLTFDDLMAISTAISIAKFVLE